MQVNDDFDKLILSGALEPAGIDPDTGEMLYNFTKKLEKISPVLHREIQNMFSTHIMTLWEKEIVEMDITEENPLVKLTEKAFDYNVIKDLDEEVLYTLKEIKRSLS